MGKKRIILWFVIAACILFCGCAIHGTELGSVEETVEARVEATGMEETEAVATELGTMEPEAAELEVTGAETTEQEGSGSKAAEPEATEPETAELETMEAEAAGPEATEPEATKLEETEPAEAEPEYTVTEVEPYTMYATTSLNVREKAYKAADRVYVLGINEEVQVRAQCDNGWVYVSSSKGEGYCNSHYLASEPIAQPVPEASTSYPDSDVSSVIVRGNCTDEQYQKCMGLWAIIPQHWQQRLEDCGWKIILTNDDFWTSYGYSDVVVGLTVFDEKVTYVKPSTGRIGVTFVHEVGHFVDWYYGFPSQTSEFTGLFTDEKDVFDEYQNYDNHAQSNTIEYFATIWCQIYMAPDTEDSAPDSFAYVKQYCQ